MRIRLRWILAAGAALFTLGLATSALGVEPDCREECAEARVTCHAAAHHAHRVCREACAEDDGQCLDTCRWAFSVAKARCAKERMECRQACQPGGSCDCIAGCAEGLEECRDALAECRGGCREQTRDRLARCRALAENGAPPPIVRACVAKAERHGVECGLMCQSVLQCGGRFASCVEDCP